MIMWSVTIISMSLCRAAIAGSKKEEEEEEESKIADNEGSKGVCLINCHVVFWLLPYSLTQGTVNSPYSEPMVVVTFDLRNKRMVFNALRIDCTFCCGFLSYAFLDGGT